MNGYDLDPATCPHRTINDHGEGWASCVDCGSELYVGGA